MSEDIESAVQYMRLRIAYNLEAFKNIKAHIDGLSTENELPEELAGDLAEITDQVVQFITRWQDHHSQQLAILETVADDLTSHDNETSIIHQH